MLIQIVFILSHFLLFTIFYLIPKAHKMLAIMLDHWFKNIKVVHEFVGNNVVASWESMIKKLSCPCSYKCTSIWIMWVHLLVMKIIKMNMIFLVNMFMMNMQFPLLWKLSCNYFVACVWTLKNVKNPFRWWASHETQSSNVFFLACYVFRIIKFNLKPREFSAL
jgi:hypothetical protein